MDLVFLVFSKFITDIIFSVCSTPIILRLYTLIICTSPLYIWIVITIVFGLTGCQDYEAGLISLLIIKYICIAALGYIGAKILRGNISIMCRNCSMAFV